MRQEAMLNTTDRRQLGALDSRGGWGGRKFERNRETDHLNYMTGNEFFAASLRHTISFHILSQREIGEQGYSDKFPHFEEQITLMCNQIVMSYCEWR